MPNMGVNTLKQNLTNPARAYLWEIIIPNPIGGGDSTILSARCFSTALPGRSFGEITIPYKQTGGVRFPGKLTYGHTWECTFTEGEDAKIFDAIYAWKQKVISDYDGVGVGDQDIKQDVYLTLIKTKGDVWLKIALIGCYPQEVGNVDLSYDTEDPIRFTVTWAYDYWEKRS